MRPIHAYFLLFYCLIAQFVIIASDQDDETLGQKRAMRNALIRFGRSGIRNALVRFHRKMIPLIKRTELSNFSTRGTYHASNVEQTQNTSICIPHSKFGKRMSDMHFLDPENRRAAAFHPSRRLSSRHLRK